MKNNHASDLKHEAADRAFVASQHFSEFVSEHPFVEGRADLKRMASDIEEQMARLYQAIWNV